MATIQINPRMTIGAYKQLVKDRVRAKAETVLGISGAGAVLMEVANHFPLIVQTEGKMDRLMLVEFILMAGAATNMFDAFREVRTANMTIRRAKKLNERNKDLLRSA